MDCRQSFTQRKAQMSQDDTSTGSRQTTVNKKPEKKTPLTEITELEIGHL